MKSLASSDVSANSGSSKFHLQARMLFRVSLSSSPRNGQRPLRLAGKSDQRLKSYNVGWPGDARLHFYSQHVGNDTEAPHVRVEGHKIVVDDLRSEKLGSAKIHPQFLPGFIPVAGDTIITSFLMTLGSGLGQHNRTYTLARPKSMILILFVTLFTQRMFSGWNSPQTKTAEIQSLADLKTLWKAAGVTHHRPWGPGGGCTSCACAAGPHRSAGWRWRHQVPLECSSHQWSCQTVHRRQR